MPGDLARRQAAGKIQPNKYPHAKASTNITRKRATHLVHQLVGLILSLIIVKRIINRISHHLTRHVQLGVLLHGQET